MAVILTTARDAKGGKACKSTVLDAQGLADLLRHGRLKPSFIPPLPIRELRELTRYRESVGREQTALANRIQKLIESATLKLGQGASERRAGREWPGEAAGRSRGRDRRRAAASLSPPLPQAQAPAVATGPGGTGDSSPAVWIRSPLLDQYDQSAAALTRVEERITQEVESSPDSFVPEAVKLRDTIPGVGERGAQIIVAESGVDMDRFPTDHHLASWAGRCPGNNASAGKRKSGKTSKGSRSLRAALVQAAWAASHHKGTYLAAQYRRFGKRMGKKKALVAVGHRILLSVYHVLQDRVSYQVLGGDYFDRRKVDKQRQRLIRQLASLGVKVTVEEVKEAA